MEIQKIKVSEIISYDRNPRRNDHVVDKVAAGIREFGFRVPVILKKDKTLIDGHLRLKAAKKLGLEEIPALFATDMNETQIKAFRISINKLAELADWDEDLLSLEFEDLKLANFDLDLTGFNPEDVSAITEMPEVDFASIDDQSRLDQKKSSNETHKCPSCGFEFKD